MQRALSLKLFVTACAVALILAIASGACNAGRAGSIVLNDSSAEQEGYVLIAPYRIDLAAQDNPPQGLVELIDRNGIVMHTWHTEHPVLVAELLRDGTLYISMTPEINQATYPGFGTTGVLEKLDWDGNVLWKHEDPLMTLDFDVLPDGSVAYLRWANMPTAFASAVRGGFSNATSSVWGNDIAVVNREGSTTLAWSMASHLNPSVYPISDAVAHQEFSHANSLRYVADNPITHTPAYLLSARHLSKAFLIDAGTGKIIWESPDGLYSLQHDVSLLPNGDVLAFDNGFARAHTAALLSRAVEIALPKGNIVWSYSGGTTMTGKAQFASSIMGGAERLANDDTLITLSTAGRIQEVTPEGKVVWEFVHTARDPDGEARLLFRARLYEAAGTEWGRRLVLPSFLSSAFCRAS